MAMLKTGQKAPAFDLPDLEDKRHSLEHVLARGPALAVFWKPGCGTCHLAFPYLQRLAEAYPSDGWTLLSISQDSAQASGDFARQYELTFPTLIDGDGWPVSHEYDPDATPTFFLIDRDGTVEMTSIGFDKGDLNEVSRRLAEHLGEAPRVIAEEDDGNPPFKPG
jgi:peroxiredoxin